MKMDNPDTLALSPGDHVGPYEVVARIGVGGMGEVYRAIDTTLKRAVAIKVLPASVAGDAQRLARFEREAEVLASLNHPNIAAIYGVQPWARGIALVMELVEGDISGVHELQEPQLEALTDRFSMQGDLRTQSEQWSVELR